MSGKYKEYDAKLIELIRGGCVTFDCLCRRLQDENMKISGKASDGFRVTDHRLQALRKAGKIAYHQPRKRWCLEAGV